MFTRIFTSVIDRVGKRCHRQGVRNFIQDSANKPSDAISQSQNSEVKLSRKERVINYFKMVKYDYTEALKEVTDFYKAKPVKAGVYSTLLGLGLYASYTNPDERSFWDNFIVSAQDLSLVGDRVRSPGSQQLVDYVSRAYNAGLVRRLNLGVASLIWVDNYDEVEPINFYIDTGCFPRVQCIGNAATTTELKL